MPRSVSKASLSLENLETREVPAIVLAGTFSGGVVTANGGNVTVNEIGGTFQAFNPAGGATKTTFTRSNTAADIINLTSSGNTLTITDSDGIFVQTSANSPDFIGTSITVSNVTGLKIDLQLGGDDVVNDNTSFATVINGGAGNDTITAAGMQLNPIITQLFLKPGGLDLSFASLLSGATPVKTINGGAGKDNITITGFATNAMVDGGAGDDTITGPLAGVYNILKGGDDNDTIIDGFGVDLLDGGAGRDILYDLGSVDIFVANDQEADYIINQPGDIVLADPIDVKTAP